MVVSKRGDLDQIVLKIEFMPGAEENKTAILGRLNDQLRLRTNLGYQVECRPYGDLPRYEVKARRFKDLRQKEI